MLQHFFSNQYRLWQTTAAMPLVFVVLWSTGFIGAKLGAPYAEPFTFLGLRFAIAAALLLLVAWLTQAPWPRRGQDFAHAAIAGVLIQGIHLGGVFSAIDGGLPAGVAALIMGLQPLLTATVAGRLLGERVGGRQWLGLLLGLVGIVLVLYNRIGAGVITAGGVGFVTASLGALTFGTLYQKRYCAGIDLRTGGVIQYAASAALLLAAATLSETMQVTWSGEFIFAMVWLVLVLSVGAIGLLFTLIRRGEAYRVASLFYLSPPFAVLFAYLLFGETLGPSALMGMAIAMAGVVLVNWRSR